MAIQTQRFNELTASLYAANVEEFRIRLLLDGMLNALNGAGGCTVSGSPARTPITFSGGSTSCDQTFNEMLPYYIQAVNRYTKDVQQVNDVATAATYANWTSDVTNLLSHLSASTHCNDVTSKSPSADGGDCKFQYTLVGYKNRTGLNAVKSDAYIVFVPTQGFTLADNSETESVNFEPGMVDVVTCAKVPPLIPSFGVLSANTHYVFGRAGATAVLTEEDWLQPGALNDPARGNNPAVAFQPVETYSAADNGFGYDWYGVNFGGNAWAIGSFQYNGQTKYGYTSTPKINDLSVYDGWWNAIPYDPRNLYTGGTAPTIDVAKDCPA
jgi:hypothetical protein